LQIQPYEMAHHGTAPRTEPKRTGTEGTVQTLMELLPTAQRTYPWMATA